MSFFTINGKIATGSKEESFASVFGLIPNNTTALSSIKKFEYIDIYGTPFYQITWKLVDGEYSGREVRQKLHCFDSNENKRNRSINMMMLIHKLCNNEKDYQNHPTTNDLSVMTGNVMGIKIQEWSNDGKEGNHVSEVHETKGFVSETGTFLPKAQVINKVDQLEDLPF